MENNKGKATKNLIRKSFALIIIISLTVLLSACGGKPVRETSVIETTLAQTIRIKPKPAIRRQLRKHPGQSGFRFVHDGIEAFATLDDMIKSAKHRLDLQYYVYHDDKTGKALAYRLLQAANRGVKIRLLFDDIFMSSKTDMLSLLDAHPNIDIKVFNPVSRKRFLRPLMFFVNMARVNRRMHNKIFIVDDQIAFMGGRNIGDAYFSVKEHFHFKDVDILTIGPVVDQLRDSFDLYWGSRWALTYKKAYPYLYGFYYKSPSYNKSYREYKKIANSVWRSGYGKRVRAVRALRKLEKGRLPLVWGKAEVMVDPPKKIWRFSRKDKKFLINQMRPYFRNVKSEVIIISPYFVPGRQGMRWIKSLRKRGIRVNVLTNSFASTDIGLAHTGYQRYRRRLLRWGVNIHEMKPHAFARQKKTFTWIKSNPRSSLHAKIIVVDRRYVFVGSANFTLRSLTSNTEVMVLIDNKNVAKETLALYGYFTNTKNSYRVALRKSKSVQGPSKEVVWETRIRGKKVIINREPKAKMLKHMGATMMSILPIEGLY
jgi:putative cardiolipin synthase